MSGSWSLAGWTEQNDDRHYEPLSHIGVGSKFVVAFLRPKELNCKFAAVAVTKLAPGGRPLLSHTTKVGSFGTGVCVFRICVGIAKDKSSPTICALAQTVGGFGAQERT